MKRRHAHGSAVFLASAVILLVGFASRTHAATHPGQSFEAVGQNTARPNVSMPGMSPAVPEEGWLGVAIAEVSDQVARQAKLPRPEGVYVTGVEPDSPAAKAGIEARDIIIGYNGQRVEGMLQFGRLVRETPAGRTVFIRVSRRGAERTLSAQVASRRMLAVGGMPNPQGMVHNMPGMPMDQPFVHPLLGVRAMTVEGQLGQYFQVPGGRGVLVVDVMTNSAGEKAGLKAGDVIYQVEGKSVQDAGQLEQSLRESCSGNGVSLGIVRKGITLVIRAQIQCPASSTPSSPST